MIKKQLFAKQFLALPPYLGGKRRLVPWIFDTLATAVPIFTWSGLTFLDAFVGGGAVSLFAKFQGFQQLYCNDWSERSQIIIGALLENQCSKLSQEETLTLTAPLDDAKRPGFVQANFTPQVFASRHAGALDRMRVGTERFQSPVKQALGKLLVWHFIRDFVCMATSIGTSNRPYAETLDGLRDWQAINPKRFVDHSFPNLLKPTWHALEK